MNVRFDTSHRGPTPGPRKGLRGGITHTTEGNEQGDLAALTSTVSIHKYIPRRAGVCYDMVDLANVAYHAGWGRLAPTDPWTPDWNDYYVGWEIGHVRGEAWAPEHLARVLHVIRADCRALGITRLLRHLDIAKDRPSTIVVGGKTYQTGGVRADPTDFPFWSSFAALCLRDPYPLRGAVDIGVTPWVAALRPILSSSDAIAAYRLVTARGYRPGPLLALIGLESSFGTQGVATVSHNWGNVRTPMVANRVRGTTADGWPIFTSWLESLQDVLDRLDQKPAYAGLDDLAEVRCIWAPVGDGANNPFAGSLTMLSMIEAWRTQTQAAPDYLALWGDQAPYVPEFGIPTQWRALIDAGKSLGAAVMPEVGFSGYTVQVFEHGVIAYAPDGGLRVFRELS